MGGLSAASLLVQEKKYRVLVLERHFKTGGFTHAFSRPGGYTWDVGLHYVGQMAPGDQMRNAFDYLTQGKVKWNPMKDPFEIFSYPGFQFAVSSDSRAYEQDLIACFPEEDRAIQRYFKDIKSISRYMVSLLLPRVLRLLLSPIFFRTSRLAKQSLRSVLDNNFKDPRLKAVLASQWGDYGLPPGQSSFFIHAVIAEHYLNGGFYPEGGAATIAKSIQEIVESRSGRFLLNHEVSEILLEGRKAIGVRVRLTNGSTETYYAPEIYSDAGAQTTFLKLLPPAVGLSFRKELEDEKPGSSCVTLYLGLKHDPSSLGIHGQNFWIYSGWDHDDTFRKRNEVVDGRPSSCYLSFPSKKDPKAVFHTAEIIALVDYEPFKRWTDLPWKNRSSEYEELKKKISKGLVQLVDSQVPGFSSNIAYQELSTPLTVEHFTGHPRGQIYGFPATPERLRKNYLTARTPIENLYLVGADVGGHGIVGAMVGGILGVAAKHGFSLLWRVMRGKMHQTTT